MKTACICDIKEFTVHDGEGIRGYRISERVPVTLPVVS